MPRKPKSLAERLTGIPDRRRKPAVSIPVPQPSPASLATAPMTAYQPPPGAEQVTVTLFRGGPDDWGSRLPPLTEAVTPARSTWVAFERVDGLPVAVRVLGPPLEFRITERGEMAAWFRNAAGAPVIAMALGECLVGDKVILGTDPGREPGPER